VKVLQTTAGRRHRNGHKANLQAAAVAAAAEGLTLPGLLAATPDRTTAGSHPLGTAPLGCGARSAAN
jgi:hypothetical protein